MLGGRKVSRAQRSLLQGALPALEVGQRGHRGPAHAAAAAPFVHQRRNRARRPDGEAPRPRGARFGKSVSCVRRDPQRHLGRGGRFVLGRQKVLHPAALLIRTGVEISPRLHISFLVCSGISPYVYVLLNIGSEKKKAKPELKKRRRRRSGHLIFLLLPRLSGVSRPASKRAKEDESPGPVKFRLIC